jgi:hypothetical protein
MGSERNSLRSNNVHFFFHFLLRTNGSVTADEVQQQKHCHEQTQNTSLLRIDKSIALIFVGACQAILVTIKVVKTTQQAESS